MDKKVEPSLATFPIREYTEPDKEFIQRMLDWSVGFKAKLWKMEREEKRLEDKAPHRATSNALKVIREVLGIG